MSSEYVACETCGKDRLHYYDYVQGEDDCSACLTGTTSAWKPGDRVRLTDSCRADDPGTPGVVHSVHPGGVRVLWDDAGRPSDPIPDDVLEPA